MTATIGTFKKLETSKRVAPRMSVTVWAQQKRGKSHFALTAPQPIYYFDFDRGMETLLQQQEFRGADIYHMICRTKMLGKDALREQERLYEEFLANIEAVKNGATGGTAVIDTTTELWGLIQAIELEEIRQEKVEAGKRNTKPQRFEYSRCNIHYQEIIKSLLDNPYLNVCLLNRAKEVYSADGQATGTFAMQGQKDTPYLTEVTIQLDKEGTGLDRQYKMLIEDCRGNPALEGLVIPDPSWQTLRELVAPEG